MKRPYSNLDQIVRSSRNPWHGFAHQRALHLQRKLRVLRQVYPKITRNPLEALKQPSKPRLNSGYPHSSAWTNPSPKIGTHDVSFLLHEPLWVEFFRFWPHLLIINILNLFRFWPGPLLSWARLAFHDTQVGPHFIPAGITAMVNTWSITHDERIWSDKTVYLQLEFTINKN